MEEVITHKFSGGCGKLGGSGVTLKFWGESGKLKLWWYFWTLKSN